MESARKCWAASLGNCSPKLSREHPISQGVFGDGAIRQSGFRNVPAELPGGIDSLSAKILCTHHNSQLSELDDEAKKFADAVRSLGGDARGELAVVDGERFTRWAFKCFAGILTAGWALKGQKVAAAHPIVATIFGHAPIPEGAGLYLVSPSPERPFTGSFEFREFAVDNGNGSMLIGAQLNLFGCNFVLSIAQDQFVELIVTSKGAERLDIFGRTLVYRPTRIGLRVLDRNGHIEFRWREADAVRIEYPIPHQGAARQHAVIPSDS